MASAPRDSHGRRMHGNAQLREEPKLTADKLWKLAARETQLLPEQQRNMKMMIQVNTKGIQIYSDSKVPQPDIVTTLQGSSLAPTAPTRVTPLEPLPAVADA